MKTVFTIGLAFIGQISVAAAQERPQVELAFTGADHKSSLAPRPGIDWFALVHSATGFSLVKTRLEARSVHDACREAEVQVVAADVEKPVFMVRGIPTLREGPLDTVFSGIYVVTPSGSLTLQLSSGTRFGFGAQGTLEPYVGGNRIHSYELRIFLGSQMQSLHTFAQSIGDEDQSQLIWAGDLDRDGKPDALFDVRPYPGRGYALFLSSTASGDQVINKAADFGIPAC